MQDIADRDFPASSLRTNRSSSVMPQSQYDNEMRGVLFRNDNRTNDRAPQAKGECQIGGVRYWVSAWTATKGDGAKYQQLRFERADDKYQPANRGQGGAAPAPTAAPTAEDFGMAPGTDPDDIPF